MDAIAPLDLSGVQKKMEEAVEAEDYKSPGRQSAHCGQACAEKKAEEEACLGRCVEPGNKRISDLEKEQNPEQDPREVGEYAGYDHPV